MKLHLDKRPRSNTCDVSWRIDFSDFAPHAPQAHIRILCDEYFQAHVNTVLYALFQRHKAALPPRSAFSRIGSIGVWRECPKELVEEVEGIVRYAYTSIEVEMARYKAPSH